MPVASEGTDRDLGTAPFRRRAQAAIGSPGRGLTGSATRGDRTLGAVAVLAALLVPLILLGLAIQLWIGSAPTRATFGLSFLWRSQWNPVAGQYGALPFIFGTVVTGLISIVLATLAGMAIAVYLAEIVPVRLRGPLSFLVDLLAVVPSVVFGLWGIFVFIPWLRRTVELPLSEHFGGFFLFSGPPYGLGVLAAGILLAIMVTPTIVAITREVLLAVPEEQRNAALALGVTRWEMIRDIVVPAARTGIAGAVGLGLGRALGETMAVTMVIGNTPQISTSLLATGYSMPAVLANEFTEASTTSHLSALMEIALVLFFLTLVVNVGGRMLTQRREVAR